MFDWINENFWTFMAIMSVLLVALIGVIPATLIGLLVLLRKKGQEKGAP